MSSTTTADDRPRRPIRSYVLRTGRMTEGQKRAFDAGWARFGIDYEPEQQDFEAHFGRPGELGLEIGFGMGQSLAAMAEAAPERNFLGIEVHRPGVGRLLHTLAERDIGNVRVYCHDAVEVLEHSVAPGSLDAVQVFFPDPWHKKRHHKRRLIQPPFVALAVSRLKPGGLIHLATDWENYAEQMLEVLSAHPELRNRAGEGEYSPRPESRPLTKFEQRGARLGHGVWDLLFEKAGVSGH